MRLNKIVSGAAGAPRPLQQITQTEITQERSIF